MLRVLVLLVVFALYGAFSPLPALADDPPKADPLIQEVIIGSVEPVPTGVFKLLQYGGDGDNSGEYDTVSLPAGVFWRIEPEDVIPFRSADAKAVACGFGADPTATITLPSQKILTVNPIETLSAERWNYTPSNDERDPKSVLCWSYALPYGYGIELGTYTIMVTGNEGTLTATWQAKYPVHTRGSGVITGKIAEGAYFLGYAPNTIFQVLYYKRLPTTKRAGSFVAARTVTADEHGVAVVKTTVQRGAPFKASDLFMLIEEPFSGGTYQVVDDPLSNTRIGELGVVSTPSGIDDVSQYQSIWQGLTFKDIKKPATVTYRQTIKSDDEIRFYFNWCADSVDLLDAGKDSIYVRFFIDDTEIPNEQIWLYEAGTCLQWATILRGWEPKSQVTLTLQYTLSKPFFDGKASYATGTYTHRILVSVS